MTAQQNITFQQNLNAQHGMTCLNNRTRSVLFIYSLNLSNFETTQKIAELHKKGTLFSDRFLDKKNIPRELREVVSEVRTAS